VSRTSAAILVLLGFLVIMNLVAITLRQMFQRKW
jgi:phosphate transport system permease protein